MLIKFAFFFKKTGILGQLKCEKLKPLISILQPQSKLEMNSKYY